MVFTDQLATFHLIWTLKQCQLAFILVLPQPHISYLLQAQQTQWFPKYMLLLDVNVSMTGCAFYIATWNSEYATVFFNNRVVFRNENPPPLPNKIWWYIPICLHARTWRSTHERCTNHKLSQIELWTFQTFYTAFWVGCSINKRGVFVTCDINDKIGELWIDH